MTASAPHLPDHLVTAYEARATKNDCPPLDRPWFKTDLAAYLGVAEDTVETYRKRALRNTRADAPRPGDMPAPDGWSGHNRGAWWWPAAIIKWVAEDRPGRGVGGGRPTGR